MTETDPRRIEWLPLDALQDDPANPKAHSDDLIDASMSRHGVIDERYRRTEALSQHIAPDHEAG